MSHRKLRENKICLNCEHFVEERFCPNCGQENIETRQPFHFLFSHFIEDFTHYDGQFWKTLKYLLFFPGKLTKEFLIGKRQSYVAPVKLYIFISFVTFFIPSLLPKVTENEKEVPKVEILKKNNEGKTVVSVNANSFDENIFDKELEKENVPKTLRAFREKYFELRRKGYNGYEILEKFKETIIHMFPKALFVYLPLFAFLLWLFHNKKKWWYFEHGIFTLHYFSFLLFSFSFLTIFSSIVEVFSNWKILGVIFSLFSFVLIIYMIIYFFIAHYRLYNSSKFMSIFKGIVIFTINLFIMTFFLLGLIAISFLLIH